MSRRLLHFMMLAISISVFTVDVNAARKNFNPKKYIHLLHEEQIITSKRKQILIKIKEEYIEKRDYYCVSGEIDRCRLYAEKINITKEVFEMLTEHQEDIMIEIEEQS